MPLLVHQGRIISKLRRRLSLSLGLLASGVTCAEVTLNLEFGLMREEGGSLAAPGSMWALVVAPPDSPLPGGLEGNSSLTVADIPAARADLGGANIQPGTNLGTAVIIATGQLGPENDVIEEIKWTNEDYNNIEAGGLIGLYWFPGINSSTATLPENNFEIGGLQESMVDTSSGGQAGMVVPTNSGQTLTVAYYDETLISGGLPPSRFTAIEVPPSGYQVWRDAAFTPLQIEAGDAAPGADPDSDGLVNLVEYATGSAPLQPNPGPLGLSASGESLHLEFPRIADPELHYRIEATEDLSLSVWPDLVFESTGSDNLEELVQLSQPLSPGQRFFRLRVE